MRKINKILLWCVAVFVLLFIVANVTVALFVRKMVVSRIEQALKLPTTLKSVNIGLPLSIKLNNLRVGDLFQAKEISVSPSILGFLAGKIVLSGVTLVDPVIVLERSRDGRLSLPELEAGGKPPEIYLAGLTIRNGRFIFVDKKVDPAGLKVVLGNLQARVAKEMLPPASLKVNFKLSADILDQVGRKLGSAGSDGWLDFGPKDMDAVLTVKGLDLTYFHPYYGDFISRKKLLSAQLNVKSTLKSRNNNLKALTDFRLTNLAYAPREQKEGELPELDLAQNALEFFTDSKGNLDLEFEINTRLDKPSVSIEELKKVILRAASKNLARQSPQELMEKVNANIEQFEKIGKTLKNIFSGKD
ncbi:MAG: DUF748 domain-containing protein [Candidatus Omnitrophota bacterium]